MKKIQIVIPVINLWEEYTRSALDTISVAMMNARNHGIESSILLIDNASTDNTQEEAKKRVSAIFAYKRNNDRWGFQKSVNYGINKSFDSGCDYVFVCNNDILLHKDALWRLLERVEGMATCMDVREEVTPEEFTQIDARTKESTQESDHPNFSAFMITKACWGTVGEFDEAFAPAYFEDNDYHYRMRLAGVEAVVVPTALFYHFGSRTQNLAEEKPIVSSELFEKNRAYMIMKWGTTDAHDIHYQFPFNDEKNSLKDTKQNVINNI